MNELNFTTKKRINLIKRMENKKILIHHLNSVRTLKQQIASLEIDIQAERDKCGIKTTTLKEILISPTIYNYTPIDKINNLEQQKKELIHLLKLKQKELHSLISYRSHGIITRMMLDYYVKCIDLAELQQIYNINKDVLSNVIDKYSLRIDSMSFYCAEHDKNLLSYSKTNTANNIKEFINKESYTREEYELLYKFLDGKDLLYYDSIINCLIRFEFSLYELSKIYNISVDTLANKVYCIVLELDSYLRNEKYY